MSDEPANTTDSSVDAAGRNQRVAAGQIEGVPVRIAESWRELRRGAAASILRTHLIGAEGASLEQGQLDTLEVLCQREDGWRMGELAEALRIDPSTATRAVDRLEAVGLAQRGTAPDDRRVVQVVATEVGQRTLQGVRDLRHAGIEALLAPFDPEERLLLADLLERFVDSLNDLTAQLGPR